MSSSVRHARPETQTRKSSSPWWAYSGILAGVASLASVFLSVMMSPASAPDGVMTSELMNETYLANQPVLIAFHTVTVVAAILVVVFAAGLHRRLRRPASRDALGPMVAFAGLLLLATAQVLGSGLDTEFLFAAGNTSVNLPGDIGFYSHWVATIPWLWLGGGIAALAVASGRRSAGVPRWIGVTSWILGGLVVLISVSPLQYGAALPGTIWMIVVSMGFAVGDRSYRRSLDVVTV